MNPWAQHLANQEWQQQLDGEVDERGGVDMKSPELLIRRSTNSGVKTTPTREETLAATIEAAMCPRAIEVNATEDCTVDGTSVRYRIPRYISLPTTAFRGSIASPSSGTTQK